MDFEHFIKGEQIMLQQINEEENDGGGPAAQAGNMSDSSADSDESAKNLLV